MSSADHASKLVEAQHGIASVLRYRVQTLVSLFYMLVEIIGSCLHCHLE
jgi:hypothetical protein